MLKRLKRTYVILTSTLLGIVLLFVLCSSFYNTYNLMNNSIDLTLDYGVSDMSGVHLIIGKTELDTKTESPEDRLSSHALMSRVLFTPHGKIVREDPEYSSVSDKLIHSVIKAHKATKNETGIIRDAHIKWKVRRLSNGDLRIAIVDTSVLDATLQQHLLTDVFLFVVIMGMLVVVAQIVASWATRPIEKAWLTQRQFIADASHELKTPLAVILANTQILDNNTNTISDEDKRWITAISNEAYRMKELVQALLDLARMDAANAEGISAHPHQNLNFSQLVEKVCLQFEVLAFERGNTIITNITDDLHVFGNEETLERMVGTIIDNACKYSSQNSPITVTLLRRGTHCILQINNKGSYIASEEIPYIFNRFYRTDKARTLQQTSSYGLGLSIAANIVYENNGKIAVTSTKQDGTTFTITL